ncbi:MAG: hypothetical protein QW036_03305 [Zestosphaera sp.]
MQSKPWLVLETLAWNTYSSGKTPPLQHTAEKLINLYLDDSVGVGISSMSLARGTLGALCFAAGSRDEPRVTAGDELPQAGQGKKKAVER